MSKSQYGKGYYTGLTEGVDEGQSMGRTVGSFQLAIKMDVLVDLMHKILLEESKGGTGPDPFILIAVMRDVLKPHLGIDDEDSEQADDKPNF